MGTKSENRRINLYINGKEVQNNIKTIRGEYSKAINQISKMTIGSKEYIDKTKEIKQLKGILTDHNKNVFSMGGAWTKLKESILGVAGGMGVFTLIKGAVNSVKNLLIGSLKEADAALVSEQKLLTALNGREDVYRRLNKQAEDLMKKYNVPDEVIRGSQTFLANQGRTEEQISKTTKAAILLSNVTGGDLLESTKMLDTTFEGSIRGLGRIDSGFKDLTKEQLENGAGIDLILSKYQDFTNKDIGLGKLKSLSIAWGELRESIGKLALGEGGVMGSIGKVMTNLVYKFQDFISIPVSKEMDTQRIKVNSLAIELTNLNIPADRRNQIYNELLKIAPDVVDGIDKEAISVDLLKKNLALYNDEMIKKIAIQDSEETLSEKRQDYGEKIGQRLQAEAQLTTDLIQMKENIAKKDAERAERINDILLSDKDILAKEKEIFDLAVKETTSQEGGSILTSKKIISGERVKQLRADELKLQEEMNVALKKYTDLYKSLFGDTEPEKDKKLIIPPDEKFDPSNIGDEEISSLLALSKQKQDAMDEEAKIEQKKADEQFASILEMEKQKQEAYKESREQIIIDLDQSYQQEANLRMIAHNEELESLGTNQEARKALDEKFKKEELLRQIDHLKNVLAESQKILDSSGVAGSIGEMLTEDEKAALISKIEELKVSVSELSAEASGIDADGEKKDIFGMTVKEWEELFGKMQMAMEVAYQLGEIWSAVNQRIANQENEGLRQYESNADKKKQALEKQLKRGLISQKKYDEEVAILDLQLDEEKKKIEIAQAKRARSAAVFNILMNTAMAIMKIWADVPKGDFGVSTILLTVLAAGLGIAQLAALPPVPAYAEGGFTRGDKMYRAGEKGKEWIAPNWMNEHPYISPVIRNLEAVRSGIAPESIFRSPVVPDYEQTNSTSFNDGTGGKSSLSETKLDRMINQNQKLIDQNSDLLLYLKDPQNRRSVIVYDDLKKSNKEIDQMESLGNF